MANDRNGSSGNRARALREHWQRLALSHFGEYVQCRGADVGFAFAAQQRAQQRRGGVDGQRVPARS